MFRFRYILGIFAFAVLTCCVPRVFAQTLLWNGGKNILSKPKLQTSLAAAQSATAPSNVFMAWVDFDSPSTTNSLIYVTSMDTSGASPGVQFGTQGVQVNRNPDGPTTPPGPEINPFVTGANGGLPGCIGAVTYQDDSSGRWKVFAQAYVTSGSPIWGGSTGSPVAISDSPSVQTNPQIVPSVNGYWVVWQDSTPGLNALSPLAGQKIKAQLILANGKLSLPSQQNPGAISVCNNMGDQTKFTAVSDGSGGIIVVWLDGRNSSPTPNPNIYAQDISSTGQLQWSLPGVEVSSMTEFANNPVVAASSGGAIIAWQAYDQQVKQTDTSIFAQEISTTGTLTWGGGSPVIVANAANNQTSPKIISDGATGAFIAWMDTRTAGQSAIYMQHVNSTGVLWTANGNLVASVSGGAISPISNFNMTPDGFGGVLSTWVKLSSPGVNTKGLGFAMRTNTAGSMQWQSGGYQFAPGGGNGMMTPLATTFQYTGVNGVTVNDGCFLYLDSVGTANAIDIYGQRIGYTPIISTILDTVNFDTLHVGTTKFDTLIFVNSGDDTLTISKLAFGSSTVKSFTDTIKPVLPHKVVPGGKDTAIVARFTALSNIPVTNNVIISNNTPGADSLFSVVLMGAGKFPHDTILPIDSANFGGVRVGTSKAMTMAIKNIGTDSLTFSFDAIRFYLSGAANYTDSGSSYKTLAPDSSVNIYLQFKPQARGSFISQYEMYLNDSSNLTGTTPRNIYLSGTGIFPTLTYEAASSPVQAVNFGIVQDNVTSTRVISIANTGTDTLHLDSVYLTGSAVYTGSTIANGTAVAPGKSVNDTISFLPVTSNVLYSAQLNIVADDTSAIHILHISGKGTTSKIVFSTTDVDYGIRTASAGPFDTTVMVTYPGPDTAKVISLTIIGSSKFAVTTATPIQLVPNISKDINIVWTPDTLSKDSATIQVITQYGKPGLLYDTTDVIITGEQTVTAVWESAVAPQGVTLSQSYPNPIVSGSGGNATPAVIEFTSNHFIGYAELNVYNILGERVANLYRGAVDAGVHRVLFSPGGLTAGTYYYVLTSGSGAIARQLNIVH